VRHDIAMPHAPEHRYKRHVRHRNARAQSRENKRPYHLRAHLFEHWVERSLWERVQQHLARGRKARREGTRGRVPSLLL
jgi:hypothetical protein